MFLPPGPRRSSSLLTAVTAEVLATRITAGSPDFTLSFVDLRGRLRHVGGDPADRTATSTCCLAREENARLAVEEERNRMARDLHDILGHSLTVITVKAELAGRLMDVDPARARAEVADLERLSRDALVGRAARRRGVPRAHPAGRAGPGPGGAALGGDRGRPAAQRRGRAERHARALRVGGARGRHERHPAQRRHPVHRPPDGRAGRGRRTTGPGHASEAVPGTGHGRAHGLAGAA